MFGAGVCAALGALVNPSPRFVPVAGIITSYTPLFLFLFLLLSASVVAFFYAKHQWNIERISFILTKLQLEKSVQTEQKRISGFGQIMSQIVLETDCSGRILFINGPWLKLFLTPDGPAQRPTTILELIHEMDHEIFQKFFDGILNGSVYENQIFRLQGISKNIYPVRMIGQSICDGDIMPPLGVRIIFDDISREETKSRALYQKQATEDVIATILNSFGASNSSNIEEILSGVLQPVAELVDADRCLLVDVDEDGYTLLPGFSYCNPNSIDIPSVPVFKTLNHCPWLKRAISTNEIVNIPDTSNLPKEAKSCQGQWEKHNLKSVVCLPILVHNDLVGILVFSTVGRNAQWSESDLHLFRVLAGAYAGARQRKVDQQKLTDANRKLEHIVEFLPDATFVINQRKEVVAWNRAMEELTGVPEKEILGQGEYAYAVPFYGERLPTLINHFGDADLSQWRRLYSFVEVNGSTLYAESFVPFLNDGQGAYLWLTASALYDEDGSVIGAIQSVRDVTYRKKSEQALRNSEERYRSLVETMNDGMSVVSACGTVTFINDSLCQMLGIGKESILGSSLQSLFPGFDNLEPLSDWGGWKLAPGEALEYEVPRPDGTTFPARISPAAIEDEDGVFQGGFAIISDLTKIREAEANIHKLNEGLEQRIVDSTRELLATNSALRMSEARFRRIIESLQEGYIFYSQNTERMFTYVSPSYRNILGYDSLEGMASSLRIDMERKPNKAARDTSHKSLLGFRQPPWDLHVTCKDGSIKIMEILEVPVFSLDGNVTSVEGIGRDVTEARHNMDLIKEAQKQLMEQEKLAALGSLVAGLSHEINTPVGIGVTAASHLSVEVDQCRKSYAKDKLTKADFEEFLDSSKESAEMITNNLNRAADLMQNFKLVATDQSAGLERAFNLKEYFDDVVQSMKPRLRNTGFSILVNCPEELEMKCDPGSMYQILSNLIMNSLIHGFEGMLVGQIVLSAKMESSKIVIDYLDNGNGMSRKDHARIYEPFFTTKRGRGGTGLGMHIVYNNVTQNLGGSICCASKPGRGTRFTISVPLLAEVEHG